MVPNGSGGVTSNAMDDTSMAGSNGFPIDTQSRWIGWNVGKASIMDNYNTWVKDTRKGMWGHFCSLPL